MAKERGFKIASVEEFAPVYIELFFAVSTFWRAVGIEKLFQFVEKCESNLDWP